MSPGLYHTFLKWEIAIRTLFTLRVNLRVSVLPVVATLQFVAATILSVTAILID